MPRFLCNAKYTPSALANIQADGLQAREDALRAGWESVGATMEVCYFANAAEPWDVVCIVNAPSSDAVFAMVNTAMTSGAVTGGLCMELRTAAEATAALATPRTYSTPRP